MDAAADTVFDGRPPPTPIGVPLPPAPPGLLPCAGDFREVDLDGIAACDPWPEGGPVDCPDDEVHLPGTAGCAILGPSCPAGAFPDDAPTGALFVDPTAAAPGDGTRAAPFPELSTALAAAAVLAEADGSATVQLAAASFTDAVQLPAGVTLRGACTAGTRFEGTLVTSSGAAISADAPGCGLAQLTIAGSRRALDVAGSASLTVTDVVVRGAVSPSLLVRERGTLLGDGLLLRAADGETEPGWRFEEAGQADVQRAAVEGFGVEVTGAGALLQLRSSAVRGAGGTGVLLTAGASAALILTAVQDHGGSAVLVRGEGANARITDSHVASSEYGIVALDRGNVTLSRAVLTGHEIVAVQAEGRGAVVRLTDALLDAPNGAACDGPCDVPPEGLAALRADTGGAIDMVRVDVRGALERGAEAIDDGTIEGTDVHIAGTRSGDDGDGVSLTAGSNGDIALERIAVVNTADAAVRCSTPTSSVSLMHLNIDGGEAGACLAAADGSVEFTTAALVRCAGAGVLVTDGSFVAQDLRVDGSSAVPGLPGAGIFAGPDASLDLERFAFIGNASSGLHFGAPGALPGRRTLTITDGLIAESPVGVTRLDPAVDEAVLRAGITFEDVGVEFSTEP